MCGSGNLWEKWLSWFLKILKLSLFYSGNFKIFKNALGQFIPNCPPKRHTGIPALWTQVLDFGLLTLDYWRSKETFVAESISSIAIGGRVDSSNWLKVTPKKTFFWKFPETFKTAVFFRTFPEKCMKFIFLGVRRFWIIILLP